VECPSRNELGRPRGVRPDGARRSRRCVIAFDAACCLLLAVTPSTGPRAMNTRLFLGAFAKLVFPHLNEYSPVHFRRNSVVVLDNARIHVAALVALRVLCALKGAKVVCLPR
jgi:hypothetical protein